MLPTNAVVVAINELCFVRNIEEQRCASKGVPKGARWQGRTGRGALAELCLKGRFGRGLPAYQTLHHAKIQKAAMPSAAMLNTAMRNAAMRNAVMLGTEINNAAMRNTAMDNAAMRRGRGEIWFRW